MCSTPTPLEKHQQNGPMIITRGERTASLTNRAKVYIDGLGGLRCASLGFSERRLVVDAAAAAA
jgi:4-aminobutyrate--pyruvate transaminase